MIFLIIFIILLIVTPIIVYMQLTKEKNNYKDEEEREFIYKEYEKAKVIIEQLKNKIDKSLYNEFVKEFNNIKDYDLNKIRCLLFKLYYCQENLKYNSQPFMNKEVFLNQYILNALSIFGIDKNKIDEYDEKQLKIVYKNLVKKYHPDNHLDNKEYYKEKFQNIHTAYEVILDFIIKK